MLVTVPTTAERIEEAGRSWAHFAEKQGRVQRCRRWLPRDRTLPNTAFEKPNLTLSRYFNTRSERKRKLTTGISHAHTTGTVAWTSCAAASLTLLDAYTTHAQLRWRSSSILCADCIFTADTKQSLGQMFGMELMLPLLQMLPLQQNLCACIPPKDVLPFVACKR